MATAIVIGRTHTRICGKTYLNSARIPAALLVASFGRTPPLRTASDGSATALTVARHLRKLGDIAISKLHK